MPNNFSSCKRFATLIAIFFGISLSSQAQVGVSLKWNNNSYDELEEGLILSDDVLGSSYEIGVNYWFRLKNKRIEFLPEVAFAKASTSRVLTSQIQSSVLELNFTGIFLNMHTNIYLLDFEGDCDCPTFSKDGNKLGKGFHVILSPGYGISSYSMEQTNDPIVVNEMNFKYSTFKLGAGIGFDIGINNLITLTPHILYNKYFVAGDTSCLNCDEALEYSNSSQLQFGLRLILRPDYVKNFGYR